MFETESKYRHCDKTMIAIYKLFEMLTKEIILFVFKGINHIYSLFMSYSSTIDD